MTTATKIGGKTKRAGVERRNSPRLRCMSECLVRVEGADESLDWPGMVYNISAKGVGLALPFPALVGMVLVIEPRRRRGPGLRARARVVRTGLREYVWFHGAEFLTPLGEAELTRWLAELRAG
jgi:hypothetical protein